MPWKASRPVDLKVEFIARLKRGERMTDLCRDYGINRQTGYEVLRRFEAGGVESLLPRSRAPRHIPHKTQQELVEVILEARRAHPTWGPHKLKSVLEAQFQTTFPAPSTIGEVLKRNGLVEPRRRRRTVAPRPTVLRQVAAPNEVWCVDYKGQFRLGDQSYCYPLTMSDHYSRFIFACDAMAAISDEAACESSADVFRKHGLPVAMRSDNGAPFASTGLAGLTRLSVFWLRLGIELERIEPGHPEQNGRHERMHRTLKLETTRPAGANLLQQQERFDRFIDEFNRVRPHEALGQKPPAAVHKPSSKPFPDKLPEPSYPLHDDTLYVHHSGHLRLGPGDRYFLGKPLEGQAVGIRETDPGRWVVTFMNLDLGEIDRKSKTFTPSNPAAPSPPAVS